MKMIMDKKHRQTRLIKQKEAIIIYIKRKE